MKVQIIIALSLLIASASAGFGVNIQNLLATKQSGMLSQDNLGYIIQSQYNQYIVTNTFFAQGDLASNGKLTAVGFAKAYASFIYFVTGQTASTDVIALRYQLATFEEGGAAYVDLAGFTFVVTLDLKFIYDNYHLFDGNLDQLSATVQKLEGALGSFDTSTLLQAVFFGFDYSKDSNLSPAEWRSGFRILGYILGLNISYTSGILNDFFAAADANSDLSVSQLEATLFITSHLTLIQGLLQTVSNA
jgi:hypothetical protein